MEESTHIYTHSKLQSVHLEIRYYPYLEIERRYIDYHNKIRDNYPNYRVEKKVVTDSKGIQERTEYTFIDEFDTSEITLTNSNFIIAELKYNSYKDFKAKILSLTGPFFDIFPDIKDLLFIGMRYVNVFEFDVKEVPLQKILDYFNINLEKKAIAANNVDALQFDQRYKIDKANFKISFQLVTSLNHEKRRIVLDMDSNCPEKTKCEELSKGLDLLHKNIKDVFESIITTELKKEVLDSEEE